ncbi:hypothetical protein GJ654_14855 [Rhodoblastus acidophilus]|uniref:Uncharacterized protein n=1 Tax=Rhodoblastus acidophilus TaxID=1074 RepID=A0A6N8DPE2_RHOAC|nr:hypothetical protein [Rhodoblastus acidophilus]MCW2274485.1 hypothetical protein [Rhodoblastus acidophilus]MTV32267.1 hypothetical protein [Rhodoblastus acidophilus]
MEILSDHEAQRGLTRSEIFELYCRLLALEERLREIDAMAAVRQPFAETEEAMAEALTLQAVGSAPAQVSALG